MNNGKLVVWGMGVGVLGMSLFVGCAPTITVSRDDGGAAGVEDPGVSLGGGSGLSNGGSSGKDPSAGRAGSAIAAGSGGTGLVVGAGGGSGTAGGTSDGCPCSRRASSPVSRYCPRGTGLSVTDTIGPDGGEITLSHTASTEGALFRVKIAPGSLEALTTFKLSETTLSPPYGLFDVSPVYRVESSETAFVNGGEITVPWTVPSGAVPQGLGVYFSESPEGPWARIEDSYTNAGFEQATIIQPGYFMAAYAPTPELASCPINPVLDFATVDCGTTDAAKLFADTCAKSFCHGKNFVADLDLRTDAGLAARLLDVPAKFESIPCVDDVTQNCIPDTCPTGALLVDSANPDRSWMLSKLGVATSACGDLMPPSNGPTTADYPCFVAIINAIAALPK